MRHLFQHYEDKKKTKEPQDGLSFNDDQSQSRKSINKDYENGNGESIPEHSDWDEEEDRFLISAINSNSIPDLKIILKYRKKE